MPNFDKTGPNGKGPLTGRKMGNCEGANKVSDERPRRGLGRNRKLDGTGPNGEGPKTGRGLGVCDENTKKGE